MTPTKQNTDGGLRAASPIALLAGIWFFISPWFYGSYAFGSAWNNWIVGAAIVIVAVFRMSYPATVWISWVNCLLGIWTIASPWIYGYNVDRVRLVNSLCIGVAVLFAVGLYNGMSAPQTSQRNQI
jgi:SPW repeat-containing protein